jgi:hypothetical protein
MKNLETTPILMKKILTPVLFFAALLWQGQVFAQTVEIKNNDGTTLQILSNQNQDITLDVDGNGDFKGQLRIGAPNPGEGKVLIATDDQGNAEWREPAFGTNPNLPGALFSSSPATLIGTVANNNLWDQNSGWIYTSGSASQNMILSNKQTLLLTFDPFNSGIGGLRLHGQGVDVQGQLKLIQAPALAFGNIAEGNVLVSDANGVASWQVPSTLEGIVADPEWAEFNGTDLVTVKHKLKIGDNSITINGTQTGDNRTGGDMQVTDGNGNLAPLTIRASEVVSPLLKPSRIIATGDISGNRFVLGNNKEIRLGWGSDINMANNSQVKFGSRGNIGYTNGAWTLDSKNNTIVIESGTGHTHLRGRTKIALDANDYINPGGNGFAVSRQFSANETYIHFDVKTRQDQNNNTERYGTIGVYDVGSGSQGGSPLNFCEAGGYVHIGNKMPDNAQLSNLEPLKLAVDGLAAFKQAVVIAVPNWADYVFEPDYELMPLDSVEQFVKTQKHLPDVPSEAEVKAEGIDLAGMNAILLKKIEELYLYTLEQEKRIRELEKNQ